MSSKSYKRGQRPMKRRGPRISSHPPQILSNVTLGHSFRYISTNATATPITAVSLLCTAGTVGTVTNTTVTAFIGSVKVNRVRMWSPPSAQGAAVTCAVLWSTGAGQNSNTREVSDTSVSVSTPAHIDAKPPRNSLASFWVNGQTNPTVFTLVAPVGTIIDVSLSLTIADNEAVTTSAVATATLGGIYFLSLDPVATHRYTPVSLSTTF